MAEGLIGILLVAVTIIIFFYMINRKDYDSIKVKKIINRYVPWLIAYILVSTILNQLSIIQYNAFLLVFYIWPIFLLIKGIKKVLTKDYSSRASGIILIFVGLFFSAILFTNIVHQDIEEEAPEIVSTISNIIGITLSTLMLLFFPLMILGLIISFLFRKK